MGKPIGSMDGSITKWLCGSFERGTYQNMIGTWFPDFWRHDDDTKFNDFSCPSQWFIDCWWYTFWCWWWHFCWQWLEDEIDGVENNLMNNDDDTDDEDDLWWLFWSSVKSWFTWSIFSIVEWFELADDLIIRSIDRFSWKWSVINTFYDRRLWESSQMLWLLHSSNHWSLNEMLI